jgi:hypothetical protein
MLKINRLFLIRDGKFKMNQKKIIRRIQNFRHHFFQEKLKIKLILKNNSNYNNFKKNYWGKNLSFPNYVYLKRGLSRKNAVCTSLHEKKSHTCRDSRLTEYVKSFGQFYIFKNFLQTGRWVTELFVVNFSVQGCVDIAQQQTLHEKIHYKKLSNSSSYFFKI